MTRGLDILHPCSKGCAVINLEYCKETLAICLWVGGQSLLYIGFPLGSIFLYIFIIGIFWFTGSCSQGTINRKREVEQEEYQFSKCEQSEYMGSPVCTLPGTALLALCLGCTFYTLNLIPALNVPYLGWFKYLLVPPQHLCFPLPRGSITKHLGDVSHESFHHHCLEPAVGVQCLWDWTKARKVLRTSQVRFLSLNEYFYGEVWTRFRNSLVTAYQGHIKE